MSQKLLPSAHLLEIFMPYRGDERRMIEVIRRAVAMGFYKGIELGSFFDPTNRRTVRNIIEENQLNGTTYTTPYVKDQHLSLSDLDENGRKKAVALLKKLAELAAESGYTNLGIPSGDDPGYLKREMAKSVLAESVVEIADHCRSLGLNLLLEPLDRNAFKKQLLGPMEETVQWFKPIHEVCPNFYIHWDSAHEALERTDLKQSINWSGPYIAQVHLCNAILDHGHPCYGDLHMDVGEAPDFETEGFLKPSLGADLLKQIASFDKPEGVKDVYVSVEVLGHPGDDLWIKERNSREFLCKCFELAEMKL